MVDARSSVLDRMLRRGVIPVMRGVGPANIEPVSDALVEGGVTALEVTADSPEAAESITRLVDRMENRDVVVGAGTVLDESSAETMIAAGATFLVTPALNEDVIRTANRHGVPVMPGILTPSEALRAYEAGADAVKLFPATTVGPDHLAAMRGPLSQLTIIPTGGVTRENAPAFLAAGAAGIGIGSALVSDDIVANQRWGELQQRASTFVDLVAEHRTVASP